MASAEGHRRGAGERRTEARAAHDLLCEVVQRRTALRRQGHVRDVAHAREWQLAGVEGEVLERDLALGRKRTSTTDFPKRETVRCIWPPSWSEFADPSSASRVLRPVSWNSAPFDVAPMN